MRHHQFHKLRSFHNSCSYNHLYQPDMKMSFSGKWSNILKYKNQYIACSIYLWLMNNFMCQFILKIPIFIKLYCVYIGHLTNQNNLNWFVMIRMSCYFSIDKKLFNWNMSFQTFRRRFVVFCMYLFHYITKISE